MHLAMFSIYVPVSHILWKLEDVTICADADNWNDQSSLLFWKVLIIDVKQNPENRI